ncbi:hypothetical protein [Thiosocius teredinicola]|uniref:hypothetical protein n=1 Tax=Thiosocius teredinicola TaxID=1973002 RepID=UPI00099101F2
MSDKLSEFEAELKAADVAHSCYHDCIHVELPNDFGILELKLWPDEDDSIQLIDGDFHTHSEILAVELGVPRAAAFALFAKKIFESELLLIEEVSHEGAKRRTIENDLQEYLKYLPTGASYRVRNET